MKTEKTRAKAAAAKKSANINYSVKALLKVLLGYTRPYAGFLILTLLFSLLHVGASLYAAIVIGDAVDLIAGKNAVDFNGIFWCVIKLGACIAAVLIFQWLSAITANKVSFSVVRDVRTDAFNKLNRVPLKFIDSSSHGDIMSRIVNDSELVSDGLVLGFTQIFTGVITVIGTLGFMFALNYKIALVVVAFTPLSLFISWLIAKSSHSKIKMQAAKRGEMAGFCEEMISGQRVIKAFNYEDVSMARFESVNKELKYYGVWAMFLSSLTNPSSRLINSILYAIVAALGGYAAVHNPAFGIAALVSFLTYANHYAKPFNEITGVITELQTALASLRRVKAVLDEKEEQDDKNYPALPFCDGTLSARSVSFSYEASKPLIKNFNLSVKKGQRVAIVGPTGCGKTTLINLLMRFYDPVEGAIMMSGTDITSVSRSSVREKYGMVLQDTWLFNDTIRSNISYGKRDATDEEIVEAAKKAHIHNYIMKQEKGYDTIVSEDGGNISQGQKQLLTIARIMLTQPPMLILDEATSNIDTRTERRIQKAFGEMMRGRTSFVIAHRLSTIEDADKILVMNNGDIIESGTHAELLAQGGFYCMLYNSQFSKY